MYDEDNSEEQSLVAYYVSTTESNSNTEIASQLRQVSKRKTTRLYDSWFVYRVRCFTFNSQWQN